MFNKIITMGIIFSMIFSLIIGNSFASPTLTVWDRDVGSKIANTGHFQINDLNPDFINRYDVSKGATITKDINSTTDSVDFYSGNGHPAHLTGFLSLKNWIANTDIDGIDKNRYDFNTLNVYVSSRMFTGASLRTNKIDDVIVTLNNTVVLDLKTTQLDKRNVEFAINGKGELTTRWS